MKIDILNNLNTIEDKNNENFELKDIIADYVKKLEKINLNFKEYQEYYEYMHIYSMNKFF
jgi:cell shape-determining protein MreC